jgi:mono/diheme cytochrome c family protein
MRRLIGFVLKLLLVLVLLTGAGVGYAWWHTDRALARRIELPDAQLVVDGSPEQVERGRHLAATRGCTECHGPALAGAVMVDEQPVGRLVAPNLTRGGIGRHYDARTFEHAIRHAVAFDGTPLLVMPAQDYIGLGDDDVAALVAYLQSLPPVRNRLPDSAPAVLPRVLFALGRMPLLPALTLDHAQVGPAQAPAAAVDAEYGRYVAQTCIGCHGPGLSGGRVPGTPPQFPPARNITPDATGIGGWSEADFVRAMREGKRPDGAPIDPFMPWKSFAAMTDVEMAALWAYLQSVPARPAGNR